MKRSNRKISEKFRKKLRRKRGSWKYRSRSRDILSGKKLKYDYNLNVTYWIIIFLLFYICFIILYNIFYKLLEIFSLYLTKSNSISKFIWWFNVIDCSTQFNLICKSNEINRWANFTVSTYSTQAFTIIEFLFVSLNI
jgi:hypothetical protein